MNPQAAQAPGRRTRSTSSASAIAHGLTLIELMVTIAILGLLVTAGMPSMAEYMNNSRLRESGITLQAEALFAQNTALTRNAVVRLTTNGATVQVLEANDPNAPTLIRTRQLSPRALAASATVEFSSRGFPIDRSTTPPTDFAASSIDLSLDSATCSADLRCPRLRVAGGGGISLCANRATGC
jgi:type IV fimbrial biogenesis protein FimT